MVTETHLVDDRTDETPGAPSPGRNLWRKGTLIGLRSQSRYSRTLVFRVPGWPGDRPGQHVDVRLTAADGYSAQRSYSLADASTPNRVAITVDLIPHGEVSPYLVTTMEIGDELDVRGPIGGWFVWRLGDPVIGEGPVLLIAGGSGIVPLLAMLRARRRADDLTPTMLVYSARDTRTLIYARDLAEIAADPASPGSADVRVVYTRKAPNGHPRPPSRLAAADIEAPPTWPQPTAVRVYVCGPSGFVDHATGLLREAGYPEHRIRTERFGPSGVVQ